MKICVLFTISLIGLVLCEAVLEDNLGEIARQLIVQQLNQEEEVRNNGWSGLKRERLQHQGTRPYHSLGSMASMHDHANYVATIGMGEFVGVLNGVEFRTRHNDYQLVQPSKNTKTYKKTQKIRLPDVPPEILAKKTVAEQITEMQEWFKAWATQDHSKRDYRKYFRPVMCYLEGAWTTSRTFEESFQSKRHHLDAKTWFEMLEKVRYVASTGGKSRLENYAFLPTKILNMINGTVPQMAQWNYRILCHPIRDDLKLETFRVVDDLSYRMKYRTTLEEHKRSRGARFTLNPKPGKRFYDGVMSYGTLDQIMEQIPGMDNYPAQLLDDDDGQSAIYYPKGQTRKLNVGYYSRWYRNQLKDAMGSLTRSRGYNDASLYMARTTQSKISGVRYEECSVHRRKKVCKQHNQTWTYAVPLEINYMTPLQSWNPYNLEIKGHKTNMSLTENRKEAKTVTSNGRYGSLTNVKKAYDGIRSNLYYMTPVEFFTGGEHASDIADTSRSIKGVKDRNGKLRKVVASGTRIFFPYIKGAGLLRQRYPIMPLYSEGSAARQELEALADIAMEPMKYAHMYRDNWQQPDIRGLTLWTGNAVPNDHIHKVVLTPEQNRILQLYRNVYVKTSVAKGHFHDLVIRKYNKNRYLAIKCDGHAHCTDKHNRVMLLHLPQSTTSSTSNATKKSNIN